MVAKKKKIVAKKAKKPAKKMVKKVAKKVAKKNTKKAASKSASKKSNISKVAKVKKVAKKLKPAKPIKPAKKNIKTAAKKLPVKSVPQTMTKPRSTVQPSVSRQTMREQSNKKMPEKIQHDVFDEVVTTVITERKKPTTLLGALEFTPYQPKPGESYMNEVQRDHFRKILGAWKQQLMQDVDLTVGHLKEEAVFYADPVDRAAQEEGFNLELRTRDRERKLIKKIEQSLDLITTGEYGYCEDCGAEIGIRRLEARPTAVKCIDCKTFQEIREKQLGG